MNQDNPSISQIIFENWKYILVIIITSQLAILFTGTIDYANPIYQNSDLNKYFKMAEAAPGITDDVIRPFVYRILVPWIAGVLPFAISTNFIILNQIGLILLSVSLFVFLRDNNIPENLTFVFVIIFQLNRYFFQFNSWNYFQANDVISLAILFLSFPLIKRKKWTMLFLFLFIGMFVKEYVIIVLPAGLYFLLKEKAHKKDLFILSAIGLISFSVFIVLRMLIISEGGESLFVQYTTQVIYYSKPILLLKRFIVPFTPFGLIPIIFYKELFAFFKQNSAFLVYTITVVLISFFGEPERLMAPLAAIYFLFLASLFKNLLLGVNDKKLKTVSIILIFTISFFATFYHLWGIIKLPSRDFTMTLTVISNLIMAVVFFAMKYLPIRKSN